MEPSDLGVETMVGLGLGATVGLEGGKHPDVDPHGERRPASGQDHRPDQVVGVEIGHGGGEIGPHVLLHGVQLLRPVEPDGGYLPSVLDLEVVVAHLGRLRPRNWDAQGRI